jgi:hypothetical protein
LSGKLILTEVMGTTALVGTELMSQNDFCMYNGSMNDEETKCKSLCCGTTSTATFARPPRVPHFGKRSNACPLGVGNRGSQSSQSQQLS